MYLLECDECKTMVSENDPDHEDWVCVHKVGYLEDEDPAYLFCSGDCAADFLVRGL